MSLGAGMYVRVMNTTRFFYSFCVFAAILVFFRFALVVLSSSLVVHSSCIFVLRVRFFLCMQCIELRW